MNFLSYKNLLFWYYKNIQYFKSNLSMICIFQFTASSSTRRDPDEAMWEDSKAVAARSKSYPTKETILLRNFIGRNFICKVIKKKIIISLTVSPNVSYCNSNLSYYSLHNFFIVSLIISEREWFNSEWKWQLTSPNPSTDNSTNIGRSYQYTFVHVSINLGRIKLIYS